MNEAQTRALEDQLAEIMGKNAAEDKMRALKEKEERIEDMRRRIGRRMLNYELSQGWATWQDWWEKCGFYGADVEKAKTAKYEDKFVIVIPPPNVTGTLHLGHALTCSIQDTVCRWHRMNGKHVMWVPGTDHAGIATQSVVEKRLYVVFEFSSSIECVTVSRLRRRPTRRSFVS